MKKLLSMLLALVMLMSMMSFASAEEPLTVTVMLPDFYTDVDFVVEDNPVLAKIEEATGIKLDIQWIANSAYPDQTSYTLADPANLPMVMVLQGARDPIVVNSARQGAFWDITDMLPDYPNLKGSEGVWNNIKIDGRIYSIYRQRAQARAGIYYRSDIAAKQGITEEPKTIEDLTKLADALTEYGKANGGYALNMVKYVAGTIGIITVAHGAPYNWGVNEAGEIYPAHQDPHFLEGLNWLRDLYAKGGIDPDFMTIESGEWDKIERNEKAYMRFDCLDNGYRQQEWFEKNNGVTEDIFALVSTVTNAQGENRLWPQNAGYSGVVAITKAVKDEATVRKILSFFDWCNTPEGCAVMNYGLDGVTFWVREDGYRYTNPTDDVDMSLQTQQIQHSINQLGTNVNGDLTPYLQEKTALRMEYDGFQLTEVDKIINDPCHALTSETNVMMGTTLSQMLEDAHVQYIAGLIDEDGLRAAWDEWAAMGGDAMTAEYNDAYQATK